MSRQKYGASTLTWSLPVRVLLTLPLLLPAWLVLRMLGAIVVQVQDPQDLVSRALTGFVGGAVLLMAPRYLKSVWAPNPEWAREQHTSAAVERRLHDSLRESDPHAQAQQAPPRSSRLRW